MKKITAILIVALISNLSFSQTINKLDEMNGFKEFKLGDELSKWKNQLTQLPSEETGISDFVYNGNCCDKVFDYDVDKIILKFENLKLISIGIYTKQFQKPYEISGEYTKLRKDDFERINGSFAYLFGEASDVDYKDGSWTFTWKGEKVMLISKYEFLGTLKGDRQFIIVSSLEWLKRNLQNGF